MGDRKKIMGDLSAWHNRSFGVGQFHENWKAERGIKMSLWRWKIILSENFILCLQ